MGLVQPTTKRSWTKNIYCGELMHSNIIIISAQFFFTVNGLFQLLSHLFILNVLQECVEPLPGGWVVVSYIPSIEPMLHNFVPAATDVTVILEVPAIQLVQTQFQQTPNLPPLWTDPVYQMEFMLYSMFICPFDKSESLTGGGNTCQKMEKIVLSSKGS